jgi:tetratricopeptide (TPR) repeat protein
VESKARLIKPDKVEEKTTAEKLSDFITKNRKIFLAIVAVLCLALVGVGVYTLVSSSYAKNSSRAMEEVKTKIVAWNNETDEAKKAEMEAEIIPALESVAQKWPRSFAAQQALYGIASLHGVKKDWAQAEIFALQSADRKPGSYVVPMALEIAATAAEEQGKTEEAVQYYQRIVDQHKDDNPNIAHAYFSLGRLKEKTSDYSAALEYYNSLLADFSGTDWALLAKNRVVYLKAQGYDK